jgi:hypothetical protein
MNAPGKAHRPGQSNSAYTAQREARAAKTGRAGVARWTKKGRGASPGARRRQAEQIRSPEYA